MTIGPNNASALAPTSGPAAATPASVFSAPTAGTDFMSLLEAITGAMTGNATGVVPASTSAGQPGAAALTVAPGTVAQTAQASSATASAPAPASPLSVAAAQQAAPAPIATPAGPDSAVTIVTAAASAGGDATPAPAVPQTIAAPAQTAANDDDLAPSGSLVRQLSQPAVTSVPASLSLPTAPVAPLATAGNAPATPAIAVPAQNTTATITILPVNSATPPAAPALADTANTAAETGPVVTVPADDNSPAPATTASTANDAASPPRTDTLLASAAQSANDNGDLPQGNVGQKLPASAKIANAAPADLKKPSLDSNALTQAAALTVTPAPLIVPVAVSDKTSAAIAPLTAQFSLFTNKPASAAVTDSKAGIAAADEDGDDSESDTDSDIVADKASADTPDTAVAPLPVQDNGASDSFGQNKFSSALTQVLSLVQAGVTEPEKETRPAATETAPTGIDGILSGAGLSLVKQDGGQGLVTGFSTPAATATTAQTAYQAPADQISLTLQRAAASQTSSMTINLNPAELGRVEVSMKFGKNGSVQASVMADKAGTLALLKDDQTTLHQALQSAGLNPDSSSLSFSLRDDQAQGQQQPDTSGSNSRLADAENSAESDSQVAGSTTHYAVQNSGNGHVNLFV